LPHIEEFWKLGGFDLKSLGRKAVPVRVRPQAPNKINGLCEFKEIS
jgi:hypothetical protein